MPAVAATRSPSTGTAADNPPRVMTSTFLDRSPKGFGLLQRDRQFDSYEDDGVFYNRRPSVWIEPQGDWGQGAVQLVEIPTDVEIHDNIVAYWVPAEPARAGGAFTFAYRIYWTAEEPHPPSAAQVVATRRGRGGRPAEEGQDRLHQICHRLRRRRHREVRQRRWPHPGGRDIARHRGRPLCPEGQRDAEMAAGVRPQGHRRCAGRASRLSQGSTRNARSPRPGCFSTSRARPSP